MDFERYFYDMDMGTMKEIRPRYNFPFIEEMLKNDNPDAVSENEALVFNLNSLKKNISKYEPDIVYLEEGEIKTYPTDVLTRSLIKRFNEKFNVNVILKRTLDGKVLLSRKDRTVEEISLSDAKSFFFDNLSDTVLIMPVYANVEDNISGFVTYNIVFPKDYANKVEKVKGLLKWFTYFAYTMGYDYSSFQTFDSENAVKLSFETKFQNSNIQIYNLFHIAPKNMTNKILKNGLTSSKDETTKEVSGRKISIHHSPRVYLFNVEDEDDIKDVAMRFISQIGKKSKRWDKNLKELVMSDDFSIFRVHVDKLRDLKLYRDNSTSTRDPKNPIAVYTYSTIPPNALELVGEISR